MLQNGQQLPRFDLMIETYGTLNADKSNAVLICHALSGNHHVAGRHAAGDKYPGWWDNMVGPGKPIDTERFFVVGLNNLGGCHGSTRPFVDQPRKRRRLRCRFSGGDGERLGEIASHARRLFGHFAMGGGGRRSLGGMQALQWAIDYPERVRHALVIASSPKLSTQNIAFNDVARQAILTDPDFHGGHYARHRTLPKRGLKIAPDDGPHYLFSGRRVGQQNSAASCTAMVFNMVMMLNLKWNLIFAIKATNLPANSMPTLICS